jgi:hypothetical protein
VTPRREPPAPEYPGGPPLVTQRFPTAQAAVTFRAAHDARVVQLYRMQLRMLRAIRRQQLAAHNTVSIGGGPMSKEELINAIMAEQFPVHLMNETTHVLYHRENETWSACELCHPHQGALCECALQGSE